MPERSPDNPGHEPRPSDDALIQASSLALEEDLLAAHEGSIELAELESELDPASAGIAARRKLGVAFWIASGWLVLLVFVAIFVPWIPGLPDPIRQPSCTNPAFAAGAEAAGLSCPRAIEASKNLPPLSTTIDGGVAVLGTDNLGRDLLSRSLWGARVSLMVGVVSVAAGTLIGASIGLSSGYFRRKLDTVSMAAMDILLAFPALLLALTITTIRGKGATSATLALTIVAIPTIARLVRANTLAFTQREFVLASRTLGASHLRVMTKELLPNVTLALLPFIPLGIAVAIAAEGALAYLGQSVELPEPTLGAMINEGRPVLNDAPWVSLVPCGFLVITLLALNLLGDKLREFFSIKEISL